MEGETNMSNELILTDDYEHKRELSLLEHSQQTGQRSVYEYIVSLPSEMSRRSMKSYLKLALKVLNSDPFTFDWTQLKENLVIGLVSKLGQSYAPATVNTALAALKGVARRLWVNEILSTRDYELVKRVKGIRGSRLSKGRALSKIEISTLFEGILSSDDTTRNVRDLAIMSVLLECGLRRTECATLKYEDVHLNEDTPYLTIIGKGNKERMCFIPDKTISRLNEWFICRGNWEGPCFTRVDKYENVVKEGLTSQRVYSITKEWAEQLGMKEWTPHDMRRTYATNLLNLGIDIVTVKDMMGHSSIATTQRYDKRGTDKMRAAVQKLNAS